MSGRPFLSVFHCGSSAHEILSKAGGGRAFAFNTPSELAALEIPLADALRTLATNPALFGVSDATIWAPYEATAIAERFAKVFDSVVQPRAHIAST
jgi:hypothetical protein